MYFGILLKRLNDIKDLTKPAIDEVIKVWNFEYQPEIYALNKEYVTKLNEFTNRVIPTKDEAPVTQQEKINELSSASNQMLNVTTEYVKQKFDELAILENSYNYSPELTDEFLNHIANSTSDKVILFATMSTISNIRELIIDNALSHGYTEYRWRTQRDSRVRPKHAAMDGRWFPLKDLSPQPAGCQPGVDYNCRCWMIEFR